MLSKSLFLAHHGNSLTQIWYKIYRHRRPRRSFVIRLCLILYNKYCYIICVSFGAKKPEKSQPSPTGIGGLKRGSLEWLIHIADTDVNNCDLWFGLVKLFCCIFICCSKRHIAAVGLRNVSDPCELPGLVI